MRRELLVFLSAIMLPAMTDSELDLSAAVDVYGEWVDAAGSYFPNPKR